MPFERIECLKTFKNLIDFLSNLIAKVKVLCDFTASNKILIFFQLRYYSLSYFADKFQVDNFYLDN